MSTDDTDENVGDNVLNRVSTIPRAPNNGQTSGEHMQLVDDDSDVQGNKRKATNAADASDTSNKTQKRHRSITQELQKATISKGAEMELHRNFLESYAQIESVNGDLQYFLQTMVKMGRGLTSQVKKLQEDQKAKHNEAIGGKLAQDTLTRALAFNNIAIPTVPSKEYSKAYVSRFTFEDDDDITMEDEVVSKKKRKARSTTWAEKMEVRNAYLLEDGVLGKLETDEDRTKFYDKWWHYYLDEDKLNIDVKRGTVIDWARAENNSKGLENGPKKKGRPNIVTNEDLEGVVVGIDKYCSDNKNAPTLSQVRIAIAEMFEAKQKEKTGQAHSISKTNSLILECIVLTKLKGTYKADSACRNRARNEAENDVHNTISCIGINRQAISGARAGVSAEEASKHPIKRELFGNTDETTCVADINGFAGNGEINVILKNSKDDHIYGASSNKKKLPCRLILAPVTYANGSIYFLWTYKGAGADKINPDIFPADGIFTKEFKMGVGANSGHFFFRYVKEGTAGDISAREYLNKFILPTLKKQREGLAEMKEINLGDLGKQEFALEFSAVIQNDGASLFLNQVKIIADNGTCDKLFLNFVKGAASTTGVKGIAQACDWMTCFRDFKRVLEAWLRKFRREKLNLKKIDIGIEELKEEDKAAERRADWSGFEDDPLMGLFDTYFSGGLAAKSGVSIDKLKHVKAVIYCFTKTCGSVFTPRKIEASYEHLYPADDNCAKLALEGPAYTKTGIFQEKQEKEYVRYLMLSEDGKSVIKKAAETGIISYEYLRKLPLRRIKKPVKVIYMLRPDEQFKIGDTIKIDPGENEEIREIVAGAWNSITLDRETEKPHAMGYEIHRKGGNHRFSKKTLYDPIPITAHYDTVDKEIFGKNVKLRVRNFVREDTNLNRWSTTLMSGSGMKEQLQKAKDAAAAKERAKAAQLAADESERARALADGEKAYNVIFATEGGIAKVRPKVTVSICQDIFDFLRSKEDKPKWQWRQRNKKNPQVFTKAKKKRVTQNVMYNLIDKYVISKKPKPQRNGAGTHTRNEEEGY